MASASTRQREVGRHIQFTDGVQLPIIDRGKHSYIVNLNGKLISIWSFNCVREKGNNLKASHASTDQKQISPAPDWVKQQ